MSIKKNVSSSKQSIYYILMSIGTFDINPLGKYSSTMATPLCMRTPKMSLQCKIQTRYNVYQRITIPNKSFANDLSSRHDIIGRSNGHSIQADLKKGSALFFLSFFLLK